MIKQKLVIVDADGLVYHSSRETLEESIQVLNEKIQNIYDKTEATHSIFFISKLPYFRKRISPDYKESRGKYQTKLKYLKTLKSYLSEEYNAQSMSLVEADDLVAYWYNQKWTDKDSSVIIDPISSIIPLTEIKVILCSPDKDLLQSIEGTFFNYSYRLVDKTNPESVEKGWWVTTDDREALHFQAKQLLMGDSTDGIKCLKNVGEVKAGKILEGIHPKQYFSGILEEYTKEFGIPQGIYEFQKNYRLLHLLSTDGDYMREIGELPTFPTVNKIKTKEIITAEYI